MEDIIKSVIYTGVGIAANATEKLQKSVDELVEKGSLPKKDGKKIIDEFMKTSEDKRVEFEEKMKKAAKSVIEKFDMPRKKDFDSLVKRIEKLEKAVKTPKTTKTTRSTAKTVKKTVAKAAPKKIEKVAETKPKTTK